MEKKLKAAAISLIIFALILFFIWFFSFALFLQPVLSVTLSWDDNSLDETEFQIERKNDTTGSIFAPLDEIGASPGTGTVTFIDTFDLLEGHTYTYRVRACNLNGCSAWSNEASIIVSSAINLAPSINGFSPSYVVTTTPTTALTINGNNFAANAVVLASIVINGVPQTIQLIPASASPTQIIVDIPTLCPGCFTGIAQIRVSNSVGDPAQTSTYSSLEFSSPIPILNGVSPTAVFNNVQMTIALTGTNFLEQPPSGSFTGSIIEVETPANSNVWLPVLQSSGGVQFVSPTQINLILAPGITAGNYRLRIKNPDSGGIIAPSTISQPSVIIAVNNPSTCNAGNTPVLSSISPNPLSNSIVGAQTLTFTGSGFANGMQVFAAPSLYIPLNVLSTTTAALTGVDWNGFSPLDNLPVSIYNPTSGCASASIPWSVIESIPVISSLTPSSITTAGGNIVIMGSGYYGNNNYGTLSQVGVIANNVFTPLTGFYTYNSPTQITLIVPAFNAGTYNIAVKNPGGTISAFMPLIIQEPISPQGPGGGSGGGGGGGSGSRTYICNDNRDNDNDGLKDLADPGCTSQTDNSETNSISGIIEYECSDGIDNDDDSEIDFSDDSGCTSLTDNSENDNIVLDVDEGGQDGENISSGGQGAEIVNRIIYWLFLAILMLAIIIILVLIVRHLRKVHKFRPSYSYSSSTAVNHAPTPPNSGIGTDAYKKLLEKTAKEGEYFYA